MRETKGLGTSDRRTSAIVVVFVGVIEGYDEGRFGTLESPPIVDPTFVVFVCVITATVVVFGTRDEDDNGIFVGCLVSWKFGALDKCIARIS